MSGMEPFTEQKFRMFVTETLKKLKRFSKASKDAAMHYVCS